MKNLKIKILVWILQGLGKSGIRQTLVVRTIAKAIESEEEALHMNASWKTTAAGLITVMGQFLMQVKDPAWLSVVGQIVTALGTLLLGYHAQDSASQTPQAPK